ncbi:MAG: alanine racemase [Chromatiales bacterium]|nr:alanine racemase [Chromatiales bacterium]
MGRPARALIDLTAIKHNYQHARTLASGAKLLAVIKADGYGHGAIAVAHALKEANAFAVASIEEALELRESGIAQTIVLLEGVFSPDELPLAARLGIAIVVHSRRQLDWILAADLKIPLGVWLKLDSGMHRLGLNADDFRTAHQQLLQCRWARQPKLMSHLARADETQHPYNHKQRQAFLEATAALPGTRSLANSAAIMSLPETHFDWVRPGIMLYGATPIDPQHPASEALRPVMRLQSGLIATRELSSGEPIGYGGRFRCETNTRVGVVAIGYGDGYPRHAPDGTPVAVNGRRTRLIGRVSMDMLTVDLTDLPDARPGDPVELWGDLVSANEVALAAETIAYELFTGVTARVARQYTGRD